MDLRAMLNGPDGGASRKQQPPHQHQQQHQPQPQPPPIQPTPSAASFSASTATPTTPSHAGPPPHPQSFRDYSHSTHASPVPHPHEYPPPPPPAAVATAAAAASARPPSAHLNHTPGSAGPYQSPTSYHSPVNAFAGRPPVPPLQPPSAHDIRSPGSASISGPSPYRHTPTSSVSTASGGYPFPPTQQPPVSPVQRHQYGPLVASAGPGVGPSVGAGPYSRDSYGSNPPPQHGSVSYQQAQPMPQTPPIGTPGANHPYLHQRSHSIQSTPTPTSAHSQPGSYGPPYAQQGSPVLTTHPHPPPLDQFQQQRQSSQPPTPLGQPLPGPPPRQSPALSHQQPSSPYQKRISIISTPSTVYPLSLPVQTSPRPPPPASIQRLSSSSSHSAYDAVAESLRSERERSLSVSPKTRVPSLPSNPGHRPSSTSSDANPYQPQRLSQAPVANTAAAMELQHPHPGTPAKRKLAQRDLAPEELESDRKAPRPPHMNGNHTAPMPIVAPASMSPTTLRHRRVKHDRPPIWAQSGRDRDSPKTKSRNFSLKQYLRQNANPVGLVNGNSLHDAGVQSEHASRHPSPEATRAAVGVKAEAPNQASVNEPLMFNGQPFPWEPSIGNETPKNIVSREVADFLGIHVLQFKQLEEVHSRGAQFEIEAKLGIIIDKMTNDRLFLPDIRAGECILESGGRVAFRSSMTESQHRELNEYLNEQVKASFPRNPSAASRVQVHYVHRREVDRFFELPFQMRQRIPLCISALLQQGSPVKARVTYDQKTGNILAKIVKARIADLNIHFPHLPLDCRISINLEWDWDGPVEEIERSQIPNKERPPDRIKDRLSYKHGFYQIDLTQVTQGHQLSGPGSQPHHGASKEHELEVELEARPLIEHGRMLIQGEPNKYEDLVDGLVNNVRLLARRCPPPSP
ncbi:mRNA triphosphatase CET1 [Hypoxylon crocopeplum]|nr:mRNA triphosphatase CET1 [Hypoxylon crocopeplum]